MRYPLVLLLLCILCLGVYAGSLSNEFIFDDHFLIVNNRYLKSVSFIPQLFREDVFVSHA